MGETSVSVCKKHHLRGLENGLDADTISFQVSVMMDLFDCFGTSWGPHLQTCLSLGQLSLDDFLIDSWWVRWQCWPPLSLRIFKMVRQSLIMHGSPFVDAAHLQVTVLAADDDTKHP